MNWKPLTEDRDVVEVNGEAYFWCQLRHDWISVETDKPLTGYVPSSQDEKMQVLIGQIAKEAHRQGKGFLKVLSQKKFNNQRKQLLEQVEDILSDPDTEIAEMFKASMASVGIRLDKLLKVIRA
jgi:hypothetical protein